MNKQLQLLDFIVIGIYLIIVTIFGIIQGRKEKNSEDFFLAGRSMSWFMVFLSVLATEISAVSFIGTPEEGFRATYLYLQFAIGSLIGRYLIAYILLPSFYERKINTIYEYLKYRFGSISHILSTIFFFITRIMASGVRLYAASLALSVVTGWSLALSLAITVSVAVFYTCIGGLKAVMWTDMIQIFIFFGGAIIGLYYILNAIPDGFMGVLNYVKSFHVSEGIDKFQIFNFSFNLGDPHSFIVSILFGCFMTFAALGADQDLAQRLLTCKKLKSSQKAIILTGYVDFPVVLLFLFIGTSLFVFFKVHPEYTLPGSSSKIFPYYIVNFLPQGICGLLLAGIMASAMSSLDSAMNALASSAVLDIYVPYFRKNAEDKEILFVSRLCIVLVGILLVSFAWLCKGRDGVLFIAFKLVSFTYGALLGVFILGILTKKGSDIGNVFAMFGSTFLVTLIHLTQTYLIKYKIITDQFIGWSWYIIIGTLSTVLIGYLFKPKSNEFKD